MDEAEALGERGLALLSQRQEDCDNRSGMFNCLNALATVALQRGRFRQAIAFLQRQEALGLFSDQQGFFTQGRHLNNLGLLETRADDYAAAKAHLERALELGRQEGTLRGRVETLTLLGDAHLYAGEGEASRRSYQEAAALVRQEGLGWGNDDYALSGLGRAALELGDLEEARNVACELLERHPLHDDLHRAALELLGRVAIAQGRYDQATAYLRQVAQMCLERSGSLGVGQLNTLQDIFLSFTELWVKQGRYVQAAAVLAFLLQHLHDAYARV